MSGYVRERKLGIAAITVTSLLWGTTGTAATFSTAGPLAIGSAALGLGGLLQAVIAIPALRAEASKLRRSPMIVLLGALTVAVYPLAFYSSMHFAGVAIGSVVSLASAPIASGLIERFSDRRGLSRWWIAAVAIGTVGSVLLAVSKIGDPTASGWHVMLGIALGLVAGASYASYSWAAQRLMEGGVSRASSMGAVFGVGGLLLMPVLVMTGSEHLESMQNLGVAAYMALVPMFLGYVMFGYGLARVQASTATTVTLSEPAVAAVLAVVLVGERLTTIGWVGLALIGVVLVILTLAPTNGPE